MQNEGIDYGFTVQKKIKMIACGSYLETWPIKDNKGTTLTNKLCLTKHQHKHRKEQIVRRSQV